MNLPSNVMKNILDFCGEPLPKNGEKDDRELTKWIGTPEGIAYYKIDEVTRSVQKLRPKYEVKLGKKYIKIDNSRNSYEHILEWFRNKDGTLNNRYRISEEGRRRHENLCLICGLESMDGQPNWKQSCSKCYWKVREKKQDNKLVYVFRD